MAKNVRWGDGSDEPRAAKLAGIIAWGRPQAYPDPQLRPYVWSREWMDQSALPGLGVKAAQLGALIVGPTGSLPAGGELRLA